MKYRFRLFNSDNPDDMLEFEELMTSANVEESVNIVQKETKLTEAGQYLIALHWLESGPSSDDKKRIKELIDEGI